jgi:hypothetical protein
MNVSGIIAVLLAADSTANGLLAGRVYPGVVKQEAGYPAVAVNLVDPGPTNTKTQASDMDLTRVQVDVYGSTYSSAAATSAAIRSALDYYAGTVALTGGGSVVVAHIEYKSESDGFVEKPDIFRRMCEYSISIKN